MTISNLISKKAPKVDSTATLSEVSYAMSDYSVGIVPVTNGGQLVGVITYQDLALKTRTQSNRSRPLLAQDIMTPHPVIVTQDTEVESAIEVMKQRNIRHLVVAGENDTIEGVVSIDDIRRKCPKSVEHDRQSNEESYLPGLYLG